MNKKVLDVTCGNRGMWFNKNDARALFLDKRECVIDMADNNLVRGNGIPLKPWKLNIIPDMVEDFTKISLPSNSFHVVVFDPPHAFFGKSGFMAKQYGTLQGVDWRDILSKGFSECFRVLKINGVLIFKWNELDIPVREILKLTNEKPLFGHKSGKQSKTHWICFLKEGEKR